MMTPDLNAPMPESDLTPEAAQRELERRAQEASPVHCVDRRGQDWEEPAQTEPALPDGPDRDAWKQKPEQPVRRLSMPRPAEMIDTWREMAEALGFDNIINSGLQVVDLARKGSPVGPDGRPLIIDGHAARLVVEFEPTNAKPDPARLAAVKKRMQRNGMEKTLKTEEARPSSVQVPAFRPPPGIGRKP